MQPNVLYLHTHDTGRFVQPYGYATPTPHIYQLARGGVTFRQAHCVAPTCSPSRAALLTGQPAHAAGMLGLAHNGFELTDPSRHLVHPLRRAGYQTVRVGCQHVAVGTDRNPPNPGYDRILDIEGIKAPQVAHSACAFLEEDHDAPFFLAVGLWETHRGFPTVKHPDDSPRWRAPLPGLPDTPVVRDDVAGFHASCRRMDEGVGRVLETLERTGLADNTLVVLTTDHGAAFPGMKCTLRDAGTGVMLILRGPGGFSGGRVVDAMVDHTDLYPTLCDLAGVAPPAWLTGSSLCPLINGPLDPADPAALHDAIYAQVNYHAAYEPQRSVRTSRFKYIRRYDGRDRPVLPNIDVGHTRTYLLELDRGLGGVKPAPECLFDLALDPMEATNLAGQPGYADVLADLRNRLERRMHDTADPLLTGPISLPSAACAASPDAFDSRVREGEPLEMPGD